MGAVDVFSEVLTNYGPDRAEAQRRRGDVANVYAYLGPDNEAARSNAAHWDLWRQTFRGGLWLWFRCYGDDVGDVEKIAELVTRFRPDGIVLNIEKEHEGKPLSMLLRAVSGFGLPVHASIAGVTASHVRHDFRALDTFGVHVDWQAYFDSHEGPRPDVAVRELYRSSIVHPSPPTSASSVGWEYRHRLGATYGWGRIVEGSQPPAALFDSYRRPGARNAELAVAWNQDARGNVWGLAVRDGKLRERGNVVGELMGRVQYAKIRVTLDTTRGADEAHSPDEWTEIAGSARYPNAGRRPITVYLGERCSDATLAAIARGAR